MRVIDDFPRSVEVTENLWIPMSDGLRLAARAWIPEGAKAAPVPALLECMPYRKRDFTRSRDEALHFYMAGHGYASLRLDLRGSGDSEGLLTDEYAAQEQLDILEVLAWMRRQPWCSGELGMFGISWGGFNSLQVAAKRPPGLRAIITVCSTDDRYADDAHYSGGCLLTQNLQWGSEFLTVANLAPDPEVVGETWRDQWRARLEGACFYPAEWMRHQTRDAYWKHGSVCEDFGAIECAVYAVGGWQDGYVNAVPRLMEGLKCPRKALIGPWAHAFPQVGAPGPAIGFFQEMVRWWDHWLREEETGIMDEPSYRVWLQDYIRPAASYDEKPGRWVAEDAWPSPRIERQRLHLGPLSLSETPKPGERIHLRSPQTAGLAAGDWYGAGDSGDAPIDQREDDGRSLVFDSDTLTEAFEVLGAPELTITLESDSPVAYLVARLEDVAADGASTRVSYGVLNLTHRQSHEEPSPLPVGEALEVKVVLDDLAYRFQVGHTVRLALSTSYWPMVWPTPDPVRLTVYTESSSLALPVRPPRKSDEELRAFEPPERAPKPDTTLLRPSMATRRVIRDLTTLETTYEVAGDSGDFAGAALSRIDDIDLAVGQTFRRTYHIHEYDPSSAEVRLERRAELRRGDWHTRIEVSMTMSSDRENFLLRAELRGFEGEELLVQRRWDERIPRHLV